MLTSRGSTSLYAGMSNTSSNVKPSPKKRVENSCAEREKLFAMCKDISLDKYEAN